MKRRGVIVLIVLAGVLLALGGSYYRNAMHGTGRGAAPASARPERLVAAGVRVRVEVLNASTVRGLARRATMYLRDRGFDVVGSGSTAAADRRDSTLILDRTGRAGWALLAARAMGNARIESRPDTLRDVDLTVLVGANWRPPAEPFYP